MPETVLVLASVLVAETRWQEPLEVEGGRLLLDDSGMLAVVDKVAAGLVTVAVPPGLGDLEVVSVIGDSDLPSARVWAAVDEVTEWLLDGTLRERRVPADELERGHAWTVARVRMQVPPGSEMTRCGTRRCPRGSWRRRPD